MNIVEKVVEKIKKAESIKDIDISSLESYRFIQQEFNKSDISCNDKFQTRFMSFYRLYGAGLTKDFRKTYFEIMQGKRDSKFLDHSDVKDVISRLYEIKSAKGLNCIYFSFTTKLIHTINNDLPIYDSKIREFFGFSTPNLYLDNDMRVAEYLRQYEIIKDVYIDILGYNLLDDFIEKFKISYPGFNISDVKILDFIIWSIKK